MRLINLKVCFLFYEDPYLIKLRVIIVIEFPFGIKTGR